MGLKKKYIPPWLAKQKVVPPGLIQMPLLLDLLASPDLETRLLCTATVANLMSYADSLLRRVGFVLDSGTLSDALADEWLSLLHDQAISAWERGDAFIARQKVAEALKTEVTKKLTSRRNVVSSCDATATSMEAR